MWMYENTLFTENMIEDNIGFVYIITNLTKNKQYIGKKLFSFKKRYQKNKKKKTKFVNSDWLTYTGSNEELNHDLINGDQYKKQILQLCKTKSLLNYTELKYQIELNVLFLPDKFYNSYIGTRVNRKQLGIKNQ